VGDDPLIRRREPFHPLEVEPAGWFSQAVSLCIVATMFATALVGFWQSHASRMFVSAGIEAQRLGVETVGELRQTQDRASVNLESFELAQEYLLAGANRQQQELAGAAAPGTLRRDLANLTRLSDWTGRLSEIKSGSPDSPTGDPSFPDRFFAKEDQAREELLARQDAANELFTSWKATWNTYAALLAMLAVALYLFGVSLTMHTRAKYLLAGVAASFTLVAVALASLHEARPPTAAPDAAATEYAKGKVVYLLAHDEAGYRDARDHFDKALALRPTFAAAYQERANATFAAGSPAVAGMPSVTRTADLGGIVADRRHAYDLGLKKDLSVLQDLGFEMFLDALPNPRARRAQLEASVRMTRAALELAPKDPTVEANLGVALLALDREKEARDHYHRAAVDILAGTRRESAVGGALQDLELLLRARPELKDQIVGVKEYLVGAVARGDSDDPAGAARTVSDITESIFPSEVQWVAEIPALDPDHDVVSAQWYYLDTEKRGWVVLTTVSGPVTPRRDEAGRYWSLRSYLSSTSPPACLAAGWYRIELYINGHFSASHELHTNSDFGGLVAAVSPAVNVAMCRPSTWVRSDLSRFGMIEGYVNPDRTRGVFVLRFQYPRGLESRDTLAGRYLERALASASSLFGSTPVLDEPDKTQYVMGLHSSRKAWYRYEGGRVLAGSGVHSDGAVMVTFLFGPNSYFDGDEWLGIVDSLSTYFKY
jgi:tetratricopeptide (TPR) repeat protein